MRSLYRILKIFVAITFMICLAGCGGRVDEPEASDFAGKLTVAVSIVPQSTFVKAVAGDLVDTVVLIPPGSSPANYAPSPRELEALSRASLYFSIGVPAEEANILPKIPDINKKLKVIDLASRVAQVYPDREFAPGRRDPHIWLSPKRVKVMVEIIAKELAEVDPQNEEIYEKNAKGCIQKLDELDQRIRRILEGVSGRTFIVYHPAFGYFAEDYGLNMVAIEREGKEATPETISQVIDIAKRENIKTIFYQEEIDSKQARVIAEEIGGRVVALDPLAADYIENLEKIAKALAGNED